MDYFKIDLKKVNTSLYEFREISEQMNTAVDDVISIRNNLRNKICHSDGIGEALKKVENSMMAQSAQILSLGGTLEFILEYYNSAENNIIGNNNEHIGDSFVKIGSLDVYGLNKFGKVESFSDSYNSDQTYYRSNDTVYISGGSGYVNGFGDGDPVDRFINTYLEPTGKTVGILNPSDEYKDIYGNRFYKDSKGNLCQKTLGPDKKINVEYMDSDQLENLIATKKENTKTKSDSSTKESPKGGNANEIFRTLNDIVDETAKKAKEKSHNHPYVTKMMDEIQSLSDYAEDKYDALLGDKEAQNRVREYERKSIMDAIKEDLK